jgi:hypothetical protein
LGNIGRGTTKVDVDQADVELLDQPRMVAQLCEPLYLLYRQSGQEWVAEMLVGLIESMRESIELMTGAANIIASCEL